MSAREDIEFADPAVESLLTRGTLDAGWIAAFHRRAGAEPLDGTSWTPAFFRLHHFACMYLPIRYQVWARSRGERNPESEALLGTLVTAITERLWSGFVRAAARGGPSLSAGLVDMVLGSGHPLRLSGADRAAWAARYRSEVKALSGEWRTLAAWPRWEAMALHVASFYFPMGLPTLPAATQRPLIAELAPHVHADVLALLDQWIAAAGVPVIAGAVREAARLVGRTETEILLLADVSGRGGDSGGR